MCCEKIPVIGAKTKLRSMQANLASTTELKSFKVNIMSVRVLTSYTTVNAVYLSGIFLA